MITGKIFSYECRYFYKAYIFVYKSDVHSNPPCFINTVSKMTSNSVCFIPPTSQSVLCNAECSKTIIEKDPQEFFSDITEKKYRDFTSKNLRKHHFSKSLTKALLYENKIKFLFVKAFSTITFANSKFKNHFQPTLLLLKKLEEKACLKLASNIIQRHVSNVIVIICVYFLSTLFFWYRCHVFIVNFHYIFWHRKTLTYLKHPVTPCLESNN